MPGHNEIVAEIESFHQRIKDGSNYQIDKLSDSTPLTLCDDRITTPPIGDEKIRLKIGEFPYSVVEPIIDNKIRKQATRIRAIGFLCLATGFLLQLIGQLN